MRIVVLIILIFNIDISSDIDSLIEKIKNADPSIRYKLMNKFKEKVIKLNEAQRVKAIEKLSNINSNARKVVKDIKSRRNTKHIHEHQRHDEDILKQDNIKITEIENHQEYEGDHDD
jgi:hypothetical protein